MRVIIMLLLRYMILLFGIVIDDRYGIEGNAMDLLLLDDRNGILNTIEHRMQTAQNHDLEKWDMKGCSDASDENPFFDVFASKYDWNSTTSNQCRSSSMTSSLKAMIDQLSRNARIGEKLEFTSESISITLEKVSSENLTGKHLFQSNGAEVRFPRLNLNQTTTTINLMTLPSSSIVSLTLHDQSGEIIDINNTIDPFEILIPHANNHLMPPMVRQNVTLPSKNSKFQYHYINLTHNLNRSIALHIDIESENLNLSYLIIVRFSAMPDFETDRFDQSTLLCPKDRDNRTSKYKYFIDNTRISHHQWAIVGIRELNDCNDDNLDDRISFSSDYSLRIYTSGCYYLDNHNQWQSNGLTVGSKTNERYTQCYSTHLTTFAGAFIVLPNPIDWNRLQTDFSNNLTIYITLITLALLYLTIMGYSYYKDKIDAHMLMVIPLKDNDERDAYLYQLVVFTGMRANAGTKSKVQLILSGNDDETNIRTLTADRRILDRGSTDSFIMAVPRSLGQLNYLRIWHDNSGFDSEASWYLKYVLVRDLQSMETSYFICEKWLAVEKDSGEIDRTIGVAGEFEKQELKHLLSKNAYRSMADNHLWFSIFAYHLPAANRFTRMQRCTCCFVLFLMSLMMSALYYDIKQDLSTNELEQYGLALGPFHISKEGISVSVITELIIFIPSLFLIALFRRSKDRRARTISPVGEAIQNIRSMKIPTNTKKPEKKQFLLPWWCLIVAYVLSFLLILISIFFILIKCFQYGEAKTQQWLGTIPTSFFASVLLAQPLKVLSLALLFMCLCRKKSQTEAFIEHEDPVEDFTVSTVDAQRKFPSKSLLGKTGLDPYRAKRDKLALRKLREIRLKEVKAWFILRELFYLLLFLGILYAVSFANRDVAQAHQMVNYLQREFLVRDYSHQYEYIVNNREKKNFVFENIHSVEGYWDWVEKIFAQKILHTIWKDNKNKNRTLLLDHHRVNKIIGNPILRQLRVKNDSCPTKIPYNITDTDDCNLPYTWYNEAKEPFGYDTTMNGFPQFKYTSSEDKTLIYSTTYATYMSGGYIHHINGTNVALISLGFQTLQKHRWIDRYTRAIFLTFGLYNPNANLFVHCSLLLEILPKTAQLVLRPSFQPFKLVQLYSGTDLIYCLIYVLLILYYMYAEIKLIFEMRQAYIKQFWSYINWGIIFCSWFGIVVHVLRQSELKKMTQSLKAGEKKTMNLQYFSYLDSLLTYMLGFCCFFGTLKILRLLRFNRRLSLLHLTLQKSARQMLGFLLMFSIVFVAFTNLFYFLFHAYIKSYSTWIDTALACFEMVSLHFSTVPDLKKIDPLLAGISLFLFIFLAVFLLSNMFISIIVDNFNLIRQEQLNQANEVELIRFTINKMKKWMGLGSGKQELEVNRNPVVAFPDKLDQLTLAVNKFCKDKTQ